MPELSGKGLARRRQRERLEAIGFTMATVEEINCHGDVCIYASVRARDKELRATDVILAEELRERGISAERELRAEVARQYATAIMGPPSDIEYESFPAAPSEAATGGSAGGARKGTLHPNTGSAEESALSTTPPRHASPAEIIFVPTDDGVTFTVSFGGAEFDEANLAHKVAAETIALLQGLGPVENIKLLSSDQEVTL